MMERRDFLKRSSQVAAGAIISSVAGSEVVHAGNEMLIDLSATSAVGAMRNGDFKAEDYARDLLDRARKLEVLNAFRTIDPNSVLEASRAADEARISGKTMGTLHGLPIPVKDSVDTKALPTSNGTLALRGFRPNDDAAILKPLLAQGAIVMGKTNLQELSLGWTSNNETFGPVRNPYDQTRIPGGSSGGSAAAVAARIAPLAIGLDTLGSIRVPAACCGIAGLRPTFGRYRNDGIMPLTRNKFDQVGPFARSVADLALFDAVVTGDSTAVVPMPLKGARIGVSTGYYLAGLDPQVEQITKEAFRKLRDAGATIVEVDVPDSIKDASAVAITMMAFEMISTISDFLREHGTGLTFDQVLASAGKGTQNVFKRLALAPNSPTEDVYQAMLAKRERLMNEMRQHCEENGILALAFPTMLIPPPKIGEDLFVEIRGQKVPLTVAMARNVSPGTCCSMASLVLPAGITTDGLPIGLEFDALAGKDRLLLSLGLSLEKTLGMIPGPAI